MRKKTKDILVLLAITSATLVISGCGNNDVASPKTSIAPVSVSKWYINNIRTSEGAYINTSIIESWKSDQLYGKHLSPETYTLTFSDDEENVVTFESNDGLSIKGEWRKSKNKLYIDFENGKSFTGVSFSYDEYSISSWLSITDKSNDVCYTFKETKNFKEEEYESFKNEIDYLIDNDLTDSKYNLSYINGVEADGTHTYHDKPFDKDTYIAEFKTIESKQCFALSNKVSETETKTAVFELKYDVEMYESGLYLIPKLTYIEELSNLDYFKNLEVGIKTKEISKHKYVEFVYAILGSAEFIFE